MDSEKNVTVLHQESDEPTSDLGHLANEEDHHTSKWKAIKQNPQAFLWCLFSVWTVLLVSFENQASGIVLGVPEFRKDFGSEYNGNYVLPANWQSAFNGAPVASSIIGALSAGQISDWIGRKFTIVGALVISFAAITVEFVSTTNPEFFGGKFLNGFAVGTLATVCVTYVGEIAPFALRGLLTCLIAMAWTVGPFTVALILNSVGTYQNRWAYRSIFCAQYGFATVSAILIPFMPESPWWLVNAQREEKALRSLRRLGYNKEGEDQKRLAVIKVTLERVRKETEGVTYLECFRRSNLRRTIISIAPLSIQALSGVSWVAGYSTYYMQLAGYSDQMSFRLAVATQVLSMVGNVMSWYLVDKFGRRNTTFYGMLVLTVLLLITGGLACDSSNVSAIKGTVALIMVYCWWYNVTIGATAYTLLTEVATSRLRSKTIAIGLALQNALYLMWGFVLPYLFNPDSKSIPSSLACRNHSNIVFRSQSRSQGCFRLRWSMRSLPRLSLLLPARDNR